MSGNIFPGIPLKSQPLPLTPHKRSRHVIGLDDRDQSQRIKLPTAFYFPPAEELMWTLVSSEKVLNLC